MNMTCEEASKLISRRLDGDLMETESEALDAHLSECTLCREEYRNQKRITATLAGASQPAFPLALGKRLKETVFAESGAQSRRTTVPLFRLAAVAALLMLTAGIVYLAFALVSARVENAALTLALNAASGRPSPGPDRLQALRIVPTEAAVVEQLQAFHAVRDYMGGAMRWMVTDGDNVEFGMAGGNGAHAAMPRQDTIVLNFQYRQIMNDQPPVVLSNPEFVLFSGDEVSVNLRGRSPGEPLLRYRVSAERLVGGDIRTQVNFVNDETAQDDVSGSLAVRTQLTPGKPVLIGAGGTGERRWELYMWGVARPGDYGALKVEHSSL